MKNRHKNHKTTNNMEMPKVQKLFKIGPKLVQNRSKVAPKSINICPKSCPKRSAATNGDPKRPKVVWING